MGRLVASDGVRRTGEPKVGHVTSWPYNGGHVSIV